MLGKEFTIVLPEEGLMNIPDEARRTYALGKWNRRYGLLENYLGGIKVVKDAFGKEVWHQIDRFVFIVKYVESKRKLNLTKLTIHEMEVILF